MPIPIRPAAGLLAAALLCACSAAKTASTAAPRPSAPPAAAAPSGPSNAPVSAAGTPGGVLLDPQQQAALTRAVGAQSAAVRPRLRYALASGDDGKRHLVVYDPGIPGADGVHSGTPHHGYVMYAVLNASGAEHYDPQQNTVIAPIPPPPQRESAATP
jgi:hypothetical protein